MDGSQPIYLTLKRWPNNWVYTTQRIRIEAPCREADALINAQRLAEMVRAELMQMEDTASFDDLLQTRRGRQ